MTLLLLIGCFNATCPPDTAGGTGADTAPAWSDPLSPDAVHLLVHGTPSEGEVDAAGGPAPAIREVGADLTPRWSLAFTATADAAADGQADGSGSAGAIRHADGRTTYARTWPPPTLGSAIETVDAAGAPLASVDAFFARVAFAHGLVETPDGDWLVADTIAGRVVAVDPDGVVLWQQSFADEGATLWPNGVDLVVGDDGEARFVVTLLYHSGDTTTDRVELWRLGGRTDAPTREWSWPPADGSDPYLGADDATGVWPHGPHLAPDGTVTVSLAARGQIALLADGATTTVMPPAPGPLVFPRDAAWLPDGSLVVADAAAEVLRVADPTGAFAVVGALRAPGVYAVGVLDCATTACLP